jgi:hypothetical protein
MAAAQGGPPIADGRRACRQALRAVSVRIASAGPLSNAWRHARPDVRHNFTKRQRGFKLWHPIAASRVTESSNQDHMVAPLPDDR